MSTITLARLQAMPAINSAVYFEPGEAPLAATPYALKQLTTIGASATLVNGSVSALDAVIVDNVTLLTEGNFYEWGAGGAKARILATDPFSNTAQLDRLITVADNATVKPVTLAAGSLSGTSYNTTTGMWTGMPDTNGTTPGLLYEVTDTAGQKAYSTTFDIVVQTPPIPPSFAGVLNSESFNLGDSVDLDWSAGFLLGNSYSLSGTLPLALTFNPATARVQGILGQLGVFGPFVVTATNGVAPDAQSNAITVTVTVLVVMVAVPDVDNPGTNQATALAAIAAAGLESSVTTAYSFTVPTGEVIAQDPPPGTAVLQGSTVALIVSLGLQPATAANVRALVTDDGYYAGYLRHEGDVLTLTTPQQFSPYWMELIDTPPDDWLIQLESFDPDIDRAILKPQPETQNVPEPFRSLLH